MKNISNQGLYKENCTKCPNCKKASWYIMECDCGNLFCEECSVEDEDHSERAVWLECPECGKTKIYI